MKTLKSKNKIVDVRYDIRRKIGSGGIATVYKARDRVLNKDVALKKIHDKYAENKNFIEMFKREAVNTARLEHENIVRVVNFIEEDESYYIVMDYVDGVDLDYLIKRCRVLDISIPPLVAFHIIGEVVKALDYAHKLKDKNTGRYLNIVHRDVSPGNIMLYYDGRVKLADFGIVQMGRKRVKNRKIAGKVSYMSPEQARGGSVDLRADLFCCGLILYELITGKKVYAGNSNMEKWEKAKKVEIDYELLQQRCKSRYLRAIIKRLLKENPAARYQSAVELFIDLKRYFMKYGGYEDIKKEYKNFLKLSLTKELSDAGKREGQNEIDKRFHEESTNINNPVKYKRKLAAKGGEKEEEESAVDAVLDASILIALILIFLILL